MLAPRGPGWEPVLIQRNTVSKPSWKKCFYVLPIYLYNLQTKDNEVWKYGFQTAYFSICELNWLFAGLWWYETLVQSYIWMYQTKRVRLLTLKVYFYTWDFFIVHQENSLKLRERGTMSCLFSLQSFIITFPFSLA